MRRLERRLPLRPGEGPHLHVKGARRIGHVADAASSGSDVVACGKHAYDPWELGGGVGVDRQDAGMRMGRSDERGNGRPTYGSRASCLAMLAPRLIRDRGTLDNLMHDSCIDPLFVRRWTAG